MTVITRFAPSPTGFLHIGGARTALFNYLFAKHHQGQFFLRIEDTDQERFSHEAVQAILDGLHWLGLKWDGEIVYQSKRANRHREVAEQLVKQGAAYYCFTNKAEIAKMREQAINQGESFLFQSPWRDASPADYPKNQPAVVRLKAPKEGVTSFLDTVQGKLEMQNIHLDDLILLRSDGTPTYMLAVVADDHDMNITHIIRGDDHITNTFKQILIYRALAWNIPQFAHIPLIHGADGTKLSKRHGALGIDAYQQMGYLPEALSNYLMRLGWSYEGDELITSEQASKLFKLEDIVKSPARLDFAKMQHINAQYLKNYDDTILAKLAFDYLSKEYVLAYEELIYLVKGMPSVKIRAQLIPELVAAAKIYLPSIPINYDSQVQEQIQQLDMVLLQEVLKLISNLTSFEQAYITQQFTQLANSKNLSLGALMQPLRLILTGSTKSPSLFELISILGKEHTIQRFLVARPDLIIPNYEDK